MKRIAIIDDEQDARQALRTLLKTYCPEVEVCGEADSVESAEQLLKQIQPHGILLDISLEDGTGFDLLEKFPNAPFQVVFTTAHDEFALKAFRYHALDYLLKPINPLELIQTMTRIKVEVPQNFPERISHLLESERNKRIDRITLTSQEGMVFLRIEDIVRLESDGSYTTFYLLNKEEHLISRPMKDFEDLLADHDFFRLHQSHIVHLPFVKKILREDGGYALMEDGYKVPIARRRKDDFLDLLKKRFSM